MHFITILFPHTTPLHAVLYTVHYSNSYMHNDHTVMYIHDNSYNDHYSVISPLCECFQHLCRLDIAGYKGTAEDSLTYSNGMQFSTKDRDNDQKSRSCASSTYHHRAWRYKDCT